MSFQGYLNTIKAKTGNGSEDFRRLAAEKGFTDGETLKPGVKAGDITIQSDTVPEPGSLLLLGTGLVGMLPIVRRKLRM